MHKSIRRQIFYGSAYTVLITSTIVLGSHYLFDINKLERIEKQVQLRVKHQHYENKTKQSSPAVSAATAAIKNTIFASPFTTFSDYNPEVEFQEELPAFKTNCHNNIFNRMMGLIVSFKFSTPERQLESLKYLVMEETKSIERLKMMESCGVVEPLTHFLKTSDEKYRREFRSKALLLLAAITSVSTRAVDYLFHRADNVMLTGLARVKNVSVGIFHDWAEENELLYKDDSKDNDTQEDYLYGNEEGEKESLKQLRKLLSTLQPDDKCMEYILYSARQRLHVHDAIKQKEMDSRYTVYDDGGIRVPSTSTRTASGMLRATCLRSLSLLSTVDENCDLIVKGNGINILLESLANNPNYYSPQQARADQLEVVRTIANITAYDKICDEIVNSKFMPLLVKWINSDNDIVLQAEASRALTNLDHHLLSRAIKKVKFESKIYKDGVYVLYPTHSAHFQHTFPRKFSSTKMSIPSIQSELPGAMMKPSKNRNETNESVAIDEVFNPNEHLGSEPVVDVVFVHGLLGGAFFTWRSLPKEGTNIRENAPELPEKDGHSICSNTENEQTACWPKFWLPMTIPNVRVLSVEYDTQLSDWASVCPAIPETNRNRTIRRRAQMLLNKLQMAGIGRRPTIFVTHSMGGLVVKSLLVESASQSGKARLLADNTKGVVFLSTPHFGSPLADYFLNKLRYIVFPSIEVDELKKNSPYLVRLHHRFSKLAKNKNIKCLSLGEKKSTSLNWALGLIVVPKESSDPKIGVFEEYDADHLEICKPNTKQDPRYLRVVRFIEEIVAKYDNNKIKEV